MDEQRTFAYIFLSCSQSEDLHNEIRADWGDSSCGDIIELFMSLEDQADGETSLWGDWQESMDRIAPVQLTLGWDPRQYLLEIFRRAGYLPFYQTGSDDCLGYRPIIYLKQLPSLQLLTSFLDSAAAEQLANPLDKTRFNNVLKTTVELAHSQNRGIMFIGKWGFDYHINARYIDNEIVKEALVQSGMKFFTRHA